MDVQKVLLTLVDTTVSIIPAMLLLVCYKVTNSSVFQMLLQYIPIITAVLVGIDFNSIINVIGDQREYVYMSGSGAVLGMFLLGGVTYKIPALVQSGVPVHIMMIAGLIVGVISFGILSKLKPIELVQALRYIPIV